MMPSLRKLAVLGSPIKHSLSPALHTAAYRALGVPWEYQRRRVEEHELRGFLGRLDDSWLGLSLTMPLKREALRLADQADELASLSQAANTLLLSEGKHVAFNTDVYGVQHTVASVLLEHAPGRGADTAATADGLSLLLFGAGATAGSVLIAVHSLGVRRCALVLRSPARATALIDLAARLGVQLSVHVLAQVQAGSDSVLHDFLDAETFSFVANTIPAAQGFSIEVPETLRQRAPLFEASYQPWPTPAAEQWARAGGRIVSGREMLLHQALVQVRIFFASDPARALPDEEAVFRAMRLAGPTV